MAKRSVAETFQAIKPKERQGIPNPPTIAVGVASNNGDLATSLSQAGQQIAQLQSAYQQQASLISANTQAVQGNTSAQGKSSVASTAVGAASSLFGGLGLLSPIISGIASLFGGSSTPAPAADLYSAFACGHQRHTELRDKCRDIGEPEYPDPECGNRSDYTGAFRNQQQPGRRGPADHGECECHGQQVVHGSQLGHRERGAGSDVEHASD